MRGMRRRRLTLLDVFISATLVQQEIYTSNFISLFLNAKNSFF
ncbi:protein of unknown function [Vibrio tapetis subsp. tapetis]|uniref:Uncharacterized protein n=1 Tax=Vibrio tapetis subsp. tapetis TaxID=1671868 RepID=A0A2N8Z846_9VIBR|nr:protein of unknown function [Vibrio tapetis subsp. tapetis]